MSRGVGNRNRRARCLGIFLAAFAAVGCGATSWAEPPSAEDLPSAERLEETGTVARVLHVPGGLGVVTRREFRHALAQVAARKGLRRPPGPEGRGYRQLKSATVDALLERVWLRGQAAEMNVRVTRRQVARERARLIRKIFDSAAEYRRFLRSAHYTPGEFFREVEVELLSTRVVRRVLRGVRGRAAAKRAVEKFVEAYKARWRARTVCAPEYIVARCSNGVYTR